MFAILTHRRMRWLGTSSEWKTVASTSTWEGGYWRQAYRKPCSQVQGYGQTCPKAGSLRGRSPMRHRDETPTGREGANSRTCGYLIGLWLCRTLTEDSGAEATHDLVRSNQQQQQQQIILILTLSTYKNIYYGLNVSLHFCGLRYILFSYLHSTIIIFLSLAEM